MLAADFAVIIRIYSLYEPIGDIKVPMGMAFSDFAQFAEALLRAIQAANFGLTPSPAKPTSPMRAAIAWKSARQR
jgi:hypothetical protein